ncbi:hypothetical protein ACFW4X_10770 [Streptomyces smyrnaeus]|uniref:hypothetical protein n=1 Tax=Streptomyces smyrnaeus TaxID=1387713 RepID=UPI0036CB19B4
MAERLTFVLTGRDDLSRTLNQAGDSAARLHQRIDGSMRANTIAVQRFTRDAHGRLHDMRGRFLSAGDAARVMGAGLPALTARLGTLTTAGDDAGDSLNRFTRDANGRLRDMRGRFVAANQAMVTMTGGLPALSARLTTVTQAGNQAGDSVNQFTRDANGRLRDLNGRFVATGRAAQGMTGTLGRTAGQARNVASASGEAAAALGSKSGGMGGAMSGVAAVAGLSLLPALGALVPMLAGAGLAAGTLKLGFSGIGEAMEASGKGQKEYAAALKKLPAPAREFTRELVGLKKEFSGVGTEVQKAMLPGFTKAVKSAGPLVKILSRNMVDLGGTFGKAAEGAAKVFRSSGFQKDLQTNLTLGKRFVGEMMSGFGGLGRSLLSFGAASGPTLRSLSSGISGLLGRALPGMFDGLKRGIGGSSKMLDGLFSAVNRVLPAFGRFAGEVARVFGPVLGAAMESAGVRAAGALDLLAGALRFLKPIFDDLAFGFRIITSLATTFGPIIRDTAGAILGAFAPVGSAVEDTAGPLERLHGVIQRNKLGFMEFGRQAGSAMISVVSVVLTALPSVIGMFGVVLRAALGFFSGMLQGAAKAFGWVPGIGDKLKKASAGFKRFKDGVVSNLDKAERKAKTFAKEAVPRLQNNRLKMNISQWNSQLREAKRQLSNKNIPPEKRTELKAKIADLKRKIAGARRELNKTPSEKITYLRGQIKDYQKKITQAKKDLKSVPPSKRSELKAKISDLQSKVKRAKRDIYSVKGGAPRKILARNLVGGAVRSARSAIRSVRGKTVYINAVMRKIGSWFMRDGGPVMLPRLATGGPVRGYPGGGPVRGPGTSTSDSILARLSNGEFVMRALAVTKYGLGFMTALNAGKIAIGEPKATAPTASLPQPTPRPAVARRPVVTAQAAPMRVQVDVHGAMDPVAVGREIQKVLKQLKRTYGANVSLGVS